MADRFPLIVDADNTNIKELPSGDNLDLTGSDIVNVVDVTTSGNMVVGGNLTVNGTTTTINSATLTIDDKNIVLASGAADAAAANGAGITIDGASANLLYSSSTDGFSFNKGVTVPNLTTTGNISFGDNDKALFGAGSDLQIYHDGSNSYISDQGSGHLKLLVRDFRINNDSDTKQIMKTVVDGQVELYHNNSKKFETTSTGIDVTGVITTDGMTTSADINFGDNDKAVFGAGSDLQIYHDGNNSWIQDAGTGILALKTDGVGISMLTSTGDTLFQANRDSDVKLYFDNAEKLETTSTGINVTGSISADGLTVDGDSFLKASGSNTTPLKVFSSSSTTNNTTTIELGDFTGGGAFEVPRASIIGQRSGSGSGGLLRFTTGESSAGTLTSRLEISDGGDISFYEDTGTTAKFFWDASAESLGIGTSSPSNKLHVADSGRNVAIIESTDAGDLNGPYLNLYRNSASPAANDYLGFLNFSGKNSTGVAVDYAFIGVQATQVTTSPAQKGDLVFFTANEASPAERMRIDSSGNLLVGTTDTNPTTGTSEGIVAQAGGLLLASNYQDAALALNRTSNDGSIAVFKKDGTTVGSIGTVDGFPYISSNSNVGLKFLSSRIRPVNSDGSDRDDAIDLGASSARFDDIYATNGTINTSDRNEKQDIAELSDAEQRVAVACKGLLRKFRWIDSVADKGDDARIHFGIIAQDLQDAFTAEGLDAGRYAMFISTTWTDEETSEERTRMGVRYSELLAFIIAAI